ncbi:MAG: hypothetical protein JOZ69_07020, partial [Myxococcales bacterium]|nr:hypothetical protein [Myxococcales bacterium]
MRQVLLLLSGVGASMWLAGCHDAGLYGHSPHYEALDDESRAILAAREYDPVMAQRQPDVWRQGKVSLFGVVQSR